LRQHATPGRLVIGSFSACANVTGIISDVDAIASLLHRYDALAFFDYAAGGPYLDIDMNSGPSTYKDAVFLSPHKFVGGPGTPGVLVFKRRIVEDTENLETTKPSTTGGGTVAFVTKRGHRSVHVHEYLARAQVHVHNIRASKHAGSLAGLSVLIIWAASRYLEKFEEREEGGTPNIVGAVRCGLVFALKDHIGPQTIMQREQTYTRMALSAWAKHPSIQVKGNTACERVSIFSFLIEHTPSGYSLHHNFVSVLLNDLFGIQSRSGCACAGPYTQMILRSGRNEVSAFENCILQGDEGLKPGLTRLNIPFFVCERVAKFIIDAVIFVAQHGWTLLPFYSCDARTGTFVHRHRGNAKHALGDIFAPITPADFADTKPTAPQKKANNTPSEEEIRGYFVEAEQACRNSRQLIAHNRDSEANVVFKPFASPEAEAMRWWLAPHQAVALLRGGTVRRLEPDMPFLPIEETVGVPAFPVFRKAAIEELGVRGILDQETRDGIQRAWASLSDEQRTLFHGVVEAYGDEAVGGKGGLSKMLCGLQGLGKMGKTWVDVRRREESLTDRRAREAMHSSGARAALRAALSSALPHAALRPQSRTNGGWRSRTSSAVRSQASTPAASSQQLVFNGVKKPPVALSSQPVGQVHAH